MATTDHAEGNRRDFLLITSGAMAAVGGAAAIWPFISQMAPDQSTIAAGAPVELDLAPISEGQMTKVVWRGKPIFIRHLSKAEIDGEKALDIATLRDPEGLDKRVKAGKESYVVVYANCTHLGCVPNKNDKAPGWFCPCHGSVFDALGRIRQGPAPTNLPLPPYQFVSDTKIRIG